VRVNDTAENEGGGHKWRPVAENNSECAESGPGTHDVMHLIWVVPLILQQFVHSNIGHPCSRVLPSYKTGIEFLAVTGTVDAFDCLVGVIAEVVAAK